MRYVFVLAAAAYGIGHVLRHSAQPLFMAWINRGLESAGGGPVAVAGCFAAGEFGAVGGRSFLHAHTASAAVFRAGAPRQIGEG